MIKALNLEGLEEQSQEFEVGGEWFILREPSEEAVKHLRSKQFRGAKLVDGKVIRETAENIADLQSYFVSLCLFKKQDNKPVQQSVILGWSAQRVKRLHDWVSQFIIGPDETVESIRAQIADLEKRLEEKLKGADSPKG